MSAFDLLQGWLRPLLEPLNEVQSVIQQPLTLHQESVSEFSSLVEGLYQGPNAFEGDAANAVKGMTESYLQLEANFSGAGTLATSTTAVGNVLTMPTTATSDIVLTDVAATSLECGSEITAAAATAAGEIGADAGLDAVTSAIDIAAVAQAGLDPVTDIPAAIVTAIDMATKIAILVALGWSIFNAVLRWINEMNRLGHVTWPPLPSFLDPGGSSNGPLYNSLSPAQEDLAKRLYNDYGHLGLSLDDITQIIEQNPHLTEDQLRLLLSKYAQVIKTYPKLVDKHGALQVFMAFIALASYDAAKGGDYNKRIPVHGTLSTGLEEAEAVLGVAENGGLPWPVKPSGHPGSEAIDANGQEWDVKSWRSGGRPPFDLAKALLKVRNEIAVKENVIVDNRQLSEKDAIDLYQAIKNAGLENKVQWWPRLPNRPMP